MSDLVDNANATAEYLAGLAVKNARTEKHGPKPTGHCLNCGETLDEERRWCDRDCATDWEKLNSRGLA